MIPRILIVLIGSLFVAGATGGRSLAPLRQESKPSIALNLSAASLMVCVGSSLPLKLELTNRGADDFKVEKFEIWNHFTYGFEGDRQTGRGGGMGSSCINCSSDSIVIAHDQMYKSSFDFNLDRDFFSDAGQYTVKLKIADVESNELQFELFNCQ